MKYRAMLYHGADECWGKSGDELLPILISSNEAMAKERRGPKGPCDGGVIFCNGVATFRLINEHWVSEKVLGTVTPGTRLPL